MKKFILSLLVISSLYIPKLYAGTITVQSFSADSGVSHLNNFRTVVVDVINGNIAGGSGGTSTVNILADSVGEIEMANDANPRVRDSELFNITTDTISGGAVSSQNTVVESGCVQATDTDLTADVSACVAYINGYRVSVAATAQTYASSSTTYLWLSQTGTYTQSTNPNTTIANSSLLASVVTSGSAITTVTNLFTTRVPGLVIPSQYRTGLVVSRDSATTLTVLPGSCEINNTMLSKTSNTTLTLTTAADWAGGTSLRAASTYGFVGIDTSGNLRLHTTAPTHDNYAVSTTSGKRRYATWSSTVYRILGWFYMDGSQNIDVAGNIKEGDVANVVISNDVTLFTTTSATDVRSSEVRFYSSGNPIEIGYSAYLSNGAGSTLMISNISYDSTAISNERRSQDANASMEHVHAHNFVHTISQGTHTYDGMVRTAGNTLSISSKSLVVKEV